MLTRCVIIVLLMFSVSGIVSAQLHHFSIEQSGGGAISGQTAGIPLFIQIVAQDSVNNTVTDFAGTVDISSDGNLSTGSGTSSPFSGGVLDSHLVIFSNTGIFFITATETGDTATGMSNTFSVVAGTPFQLLFIQQPTTTTAGSLINPPLTVQLQDSLGNNALVSGVSISLALNSGTGPLVGTATELTDGLGIATFSNLSIPASGAKTIVATASGLVPDTSIQFSILPEVLHRFLVEADGGGNIPGQIAGVPLFITITAQDTFENVVDSFTGTTDITSTGSLVSGSGTTGVFVNGILTGHEVTFSNTGNFTITATLTGGGPDGTSNSFSVIPGPLHHFLVESSSGGNILTQTGGIPFAIRVAAQDTFNNTVTGFTGTVDITSTGTLISGNGTTSSFTAGILASHSVTISPGGNFTITATQTAGSVSGTSNTFTVNNPVPSTTSITPASKTTGETGFILTVNGSNFNTASVVRHNGSDRATTFINTTQLTASILNSDIDTAGTFSITVFTPAPGGGISNIQQLLVNPPVVNAKIFLEGALTGSTMTTALRAGNFLPLTQPYASLPHNYPGIESVASIPADIVDWVLVELRTGTTSATRVARRAAFIKNDGTIVDLNGTAPVSFPTTGIGNYFVVIHHRNHLAVMSPSAITLNQSSTLFDFTTGVAQYFGGDAKSLGGGRFGMYAGDYSSDGFMDAADFIGPDNDVFLDGYRQSDLNLDGFIDISDFVFPDNNVFMGTNVPN